MMRVNPNEKNFLILRIASHAVRSIRHGYTEAEKGTRCAQERSSGQKRRRPGRNSLAPKPWPDAVRGESAGRVPADGRYQLSVATGRLCRATASGAAPGAAEGVWRTCGDRRGPIGYPSCRSETCPYRPFHRLDAGVAHRRRLDTSADVHAGAKLKPWQSGTNDHDRKGKTDGPQADPRSRGDHMHESTNRNGFEPGEISTYSLTDHIQVSRYVR